MIVRFAFTFAHKCITDIKIVPWNSISQCIFHVLHFDDIDLLDSVGGQWHDCFSNDHVFLLLSRYPTVLLFYYSAGYRFFIYYDS